MENLQRFTLITYILNLDNRRSYAQLNYSYAFRPTCRKSSCAKWKHATNPCVIQEPESKCSYFWGS